MKHFFVSILLALMPICGLWAEVREISVGSGTYKTYNSPFCNYYNHGANQIIYAGKELNVAGKISSIAFDVAAASEYAPTSIKIYMGHKASGTFADKADFVPLKDLTLVYSGTPTLGKAVGWEQYALDTPFDYDGSNLVVAIEKHATKYDGKLMYNTTSVAGSVLYRQSDSDSNYGDLDQSIEYTTSASRPNIRLTIDVQTTTLNGIEYMLSGGKAVVTGATSVLPSVVNIPASVTYGGKSYPVMAIASPIFKGNTTITSVSLPNSIGSIDSNMFDGCTSLTSVSLPSSLKEIPAYAFNGCTSLQSINIPSSVTLIGEYAFYNCTAITSLTIPANVIKLGKLCFWNLTALKELTIEDSPERLDINNGSGTYGMFRNSPLSKLYLGRNLEYYDAYYGSPFCYRTATIEVTIGRQVTELGNYLFYSGTGLKSITIPANIQRIGEKAFYGCTNLIKVINGSALTITPGSEENGNVGQYAQIVINGESFGQVGDFLYYVSDGIKTLYEYVGKASEVTIPTGYELGDDLFKENTTLTRITLPAGLSEISDRCFEGCTNLTSITIPGSVARIGRYAFSRTAVESVSLPTSVKELGDHAFYRCESLSSLTMANGGLTRIEDFTFCYCRQLTDVRVPQSVRYFGRGAFYECDKLETINIPEGVTRLGCFAFKNCINLKQIAIPASVDSIEMHTFYYCRHLAEVKLPANIEHIGSCAFAYCYDLVDCELPSSLKYIGNLAFKSCYRMPSLQLPQGIEYLGMAAFEGCSAIPSVEIPAGITRIPFSLFSGCYGLKEVKLPEGLTEIDDCGFSGCAIKSINWPASLQKVGYLAFSGSSNMKVAVVPKANTYGQLILSGNSPMDKVYCYADVILPETAFNPDAIYNTTLYVKPSMLASYRTSLWASRFKNILPIGDINGDGSYDILDMIMAVNTINDVELPPFNNFRLTHADLNGDGKQDHLDLNELSGRILQGTTITPFVPLPAAAPAPDDPFETSEGCEELYTIASFGVDTRMVLDYINEMRFEACIEGVPNPSRSGAFLTEADYVPMRWSTDLELCTRIRCSESLYTCGHHSRLNGKGIGTVSFNGVSAGMENLGWGTYGSVMGSINGYYEEKADLVFRTGKTIGHYTNLINPTHRYIGVSSMGGCSATETSSADLSAKDSYLLPPSGIQKIRLDVKSSYIDQYRVGTTQSINDQSVKTGTHQDLVIFAHITPYSDSGGYLITPREGLFKASDPEVASIDDHGRITFLQPGTVTVTGFLDGTEIGTRTFTVSCEHDYYYDPIDNNKTTGRCSKCGAEKEVGLPNRLVIYWNNSSSGSNSYSGLPYKNPVGSVLKPWIYETGATSPYGVVLVTNDRPDLLETTETASYIENWLVKGVGVAHVTFTCKYNPSITRTYTINLTEPEESASAAPLRMMTHDEDSPSVFRPAVISAQDTRLEADDAPAQMVSSESIIR